MRIYTCRGSERTGPHSLEEIQARLEARALSPTDLAWFEGSQDWIPLSQIPDLKMPAASAPPRLNAPPPLPGSAPPLIHSATPPSQYAPTSPPRTGLLIAAGVGCILLAVGLFGAGLNFLLGDDKGGLTLAGLLMIPVSVGVGVLSVQFFMAMSRNPTGCCKICGHAKPTINGTLNRHVGAVILMFHTHITGHMCQDCIRIVFWKFTPLTLAAGWWGIISFFVTPVVLINNTAYYIRSRLMK